jgi:hypothetical protein
MFCVQACDSPVEAPCPIRWRNMHPTESESVRLCGVCERTVHLCKSAEDLRRHVDAGRCVAVWVESPGGGFRDFVIGQTNDPAIG